MADLINKDVSDSGGKVKGLVGVFLAAGHGSRYRNSGGGDKLAERVPKGLFRGGLPVIVASLAPIMAVCETVVAVTRVGKIGLSQVLASQGCIVIECESAGMGESLALAINQKPKAEGWLIALADMPFIQEASIRKLAAAMKPHLICAPSFRGKRGHPVAFGKDFGDALSATTGDEGAKHLLQSNPPLLVQVDDPGVLTDIDSTEDWKQATASMTQPPKT